MKYAPPSTGSYESGLTGKSLYDIVERLVGLHFPKYTLDDIGRLIDSSRIGPKEIWGNPLISSELEDFLTSYSFTRLNQPVFERIFLAEPNESRQKLMEYMALLEAQHGSQDEAKRQVAVPLMNLKGRIDRLLEEIGKIETVDGELPIKRVAYDFFANRTSEYTYTSLLIRELGLQLPQEPQS